MELSEFLAGLSSLRLAQIRAIASDLDRLVDSVADEIDTMHAILALEQVVRRCRCTRVAAIAGHQASLVVVRAAERAGAEPADPDVIQVARAAGQVARGLVAGVDAEPHVRHLASGFRSLGELVAA
jgi:hypothetical protein